MKKRLIKIPALYGNLIVAMLALTAFNANAQQKKYVMVPDSPGKWNYTYINEAKGSYRSDANYMLSSSELAVFKKKINAVVDVLHQNPVTAAPVGYEATVSASIFANMFPFQYDVRKLAGQVPQAEIVIRFCPLSKEVNSGRVIKNCIEVQHCDVMLNCLDRTAGITGTNTYPPGEKRSSFDEISARMNEVFQAPGILKELGNGVTVYANGIMVFAREDRPCWLPVTAGDYLDRLIKYWTVYSEKEGNTLFLDMLLKERQDFTDEQLKMPAYNGGDHPASMITIIPNDRPYVRLNPGYFDKTIQRTAVQLITIDINTDLYINNFNPQQYKRGENYMDILRYYEYCKAIDIDKIRSLLDVH